MSKVFQSPGGSDSPASEPQSGPATPSEVLRARLRVSLAAVCDIASLADELRAITSRLHADNGNSGALAAEVLAARVIALANAACSAIDDQHAPVAELEGFVYAGRDVGSYRPQAAAQMVSAVLAEGAQAQGGAA